MGAKTPRNSFKAAVRVCSSKRRFPSLDVAALECRGGLKPYLCAACGGYHLTSKNVGGSLKGAEFEEAKPTFETSVLGRAKKPKTAKADVSHEAVAICMGKARPDGRVRVLIGGAQLESEPVQPATLRTQLKQGSKVQVVYRTSPSKSVRVLRILG